MYEGIEEDQLLSKRFKHGLRQLQSLRSKGEFATDVQKNLLAMLRRGQKLISEVLNQAEEALRAKDEAKAKLKEAEDEAAKVYRTLYRGCLGRHGLKVAKKENDADMFKVDINNIFYVSTDEFASLPLKEKGDLIIRTFQFTEKVLGSGDSRLTTPRRVHESFSAGIGSLGGGDSSGLPAGLIEMRNDAEKFYRAASHILAGLLVLNGKSSSDSKDILPL